MGKRGPIGAAVVLVLAVLACADLVAPSRSSRELVIAPGQILSSAREMTQTFAAQEHARVMKEVLRDPRRYYEGVDGGWREKKCVAAFNAGLEHTLPLLRSAGIQMRPAQHSRWVRSVVVTVDDRCAPFVPTLNMVPTNPSIAVGVRATAPQLADSLVSGAFVPYIEAIDSAMHAWSFPTTGDVYALANSILSAASAIHPGDYDVVAGHVNFLIDTWETYEDEPWADDVYQGDIEDPNPGSCVLLPQSIAGMPGSWKKLLGVAMFDVGVAGGIATGWWFAASSPPTAAVVLGGAGAAGIIASSGAIVAMGMQ